MPLQTGPGDVHLDQTGPLEIKTGAGDITVEHVAGDAEVTPAPARYGSIAIDGAAMIKNANGDTVIGEVTGDLRVNAANGKIAVDAGAGVVAKTAYGDIRLGEVARGSVVAQTAYGKVGVGVRDGVAAWLDLNTGFGTVVRPRRGRAPGPATSTPSRSRPAPPSATSRSGAR